MLSINQLAWAANVLVSTVSSRAAGVQRLAIRYAERVRALDRILEFKGTSHPLQDFSKGRKLMDLGDGSLFARREGICGQIYGER